jgi:hypothetical protein
VHLDHTLFQIASPPPPLLAIAAEVPAPLRSSRAADASPSRANYVFGLSPVPLPAFSIGTFAGCLPAVVRSASHKMPPSHLGAPECARRPSDAVLMPCAFTCASCDACFEQAGYVAAGQAGAEIAVNGAESNPIVLGLGVAATLSAISVAGNIATQALKDLDLDLEGGPEN